ncbi:MAG: hypothetical protein IJP92_00745 [Lachnospiraceae bacterium]|nr:hypothetical protein [Lachnospiraceae bacterium]
MEGDLIFYKGFLPYCESNNAYIIGKYDEDISRTGLDRISRSAIKDIFPQVNVLYRNGKDIVLDGDKATSRPLMDSMLSAGMKIKLIWIRCTPKTSIQRSQAEGIPTGEKHLRALCTKAENFYWEYYKKADGEIIDTDDVEDFSRFSMQDYKKQDIGREWRSRFAVFVLSHGRANTIKTVEALEKSGYTGDTWVVIDNEDDQEGLYREKFGDRVIQFDKRDYVPLTDVGDLDEGRKVGVFARNFIQDKAQEMGYDYHLQLDDDISCWNYRYVKEGSLKAKLCRRLDDVFEEFVDLMDKTPITSLSFGHPAYYPGGNIERFNRGMIPKTMTTFMMRADRKRYFHMRMNDDITTSALNGSRGDLYYTYLPLMINTELTQKGGGGMTDAYKATGTYRKSFYSIMALPSCAKIYYIGKVEDRIHHAIEWNNCVPKLLSDRWKK